MIVDWLPTGLVGTLPIWILAGTALLVFAVDALGNTSRHHRVVATIAVLGSVLAFGSTLWQLGTRAWTTQTAVLGGELVVDPLGLVFAGLVTGITVLVVVAGIDIGDRMARPTVGYSLVLLAATGMTTLGMANSLLTAFIAFELTSLPSYVLVAYRKETGAAVEAGLKYFLIGAVSSALLLYGMSLVYAVTGVLQFPAIAEAVAGTAQHGVLGIGTILLIAGFGFKIAAVPFHFWAPDAYGTAPAPIGGFLSSASKAAGFVILLRVFHTAFPISGQGSIDWVPIFAGLAVLTMLLGNLAALAQTDLKRLLAYSSIGHAGYVLIAFGGLAGTTEDTLLLAAGIVHLVVYAIMNTGAFLFAALGEYWGTGTGIDAYAGLWRDAPVAAIGMTLLLFNLAGLPLGGGFWSKFVLFTGAIDTGGWWLAAIGALASAISVYYYAAVIKTIWMDPPPATRTVDKRPRGVYLGILGTTIVTVALLGGYGVLIEPMIDLAELLLE